MDKQNPAPVTVDMADKVGVIIMNGPRLNCLSRALCQGVMQGLDTLRKREARVVVLRAQAGAKVWSAGHDIQELPLDGKDPLSWNVPFESLLRKVRDYRLPILGMIQGGVWGGACDLAALLDILAGADSASFAITPAKLGLPYNLGGLSHFLGVIPLHIIKEMLFTGQPLSARRAFDLGFLNRLVPEADLEKETMALAGEIAGLSPLAIRAVKAELAALTAAQAISPDRYEQLQGLRQEAFRSSDMREGITAFMEKRPPRFKGE
ncbi:methylmalonyl-CoA decarboxylase [Desulfocarbo indianensis]|nr:methylmalonyl-CoA decarboxylase [Desulfocarbo indianensis]